MTPKNPPIEGATEKGDELDRLAAEYAIQPSQRNYHGIEAREDAFKAGYHAALERKEISRASCCSDNEMMAKDFREALELIAAPVRADGTYNRDREACEQLAREALKEIEIGELFEQLKEARAKVDELTLTPNGRDKE